MKRSYRSDDRPRKLAARSNLCSVKHGGSSTSALPGLIDPRLPCFNVSNICSSTSAESSTVGSSSSPAPPSQAQPAIVHAAASNAPGAVLKIKLPCNSGVRDAISFKFKRSCSAADADIVRHSDSLQYSVSDHDHGDLYEEAARPLNAISKLQPQFSSIRAMVGSDVVCSMCGDEGIAELLFLCSKCVHRPQHIYCSRSYPDLCDEASICNWCLHEQNSSTASAPKASTQLEEVHCQIVPVSKAQYEVEHANSNEKHQISEDEDHNHHVAHNLNNSDEASLQVDSTEDVSVSIRGHGKAFEYLLMIAAESLLPQDMGEVHAEIKQVNHSCTAGTIINISTDLKMGSQQIKELDHRKLRMGSTIVTSNKTSIMGANLGDQNSVIKANNYSSGLNLEVSNSQEEVKMDVGDPHIVIKANNYNRRPSYRRYKLLADVVC